MDISLSISEINLEEIYEHVYDIHVDHKPREYQHLGYVDKSTDKLHLSLPTSGDELTITQSRSSLSGQEALSTGFVCWQSVSFLADWILGDQRCPFYKYFKGEPKLNVLELGTGVSAVLATLLGPRSRHYVATDQKHILKLMKKNFVDNVALSKFSSSTIEWLQIEDTGDWPKVDIVECDWEAPHHGIDRCRDLMGQDFPDFIIATDTVYNEYLVPFFVQVLSTMMGPHTGALVVVQLRDEAITAKFVEEVATQKMKLFTIKDELLSEDLIKGFGVYYILN